MGERVCMSVYIHCYKLILITSLTRYQYSTSRDTSSITRTEIKMPTSEILAMAIIFSALSAHPTNDTAKWAQFFDSDSCSGSHGIGVKLENPGCLNEPGRRSFKLHGYDFGLYYLISSPNSDCPCQSNCFALAGRENGCFRLDGSMVGSSYRFISRQNRVCPQNQC